MASSEIKVSGGNFAMTAQVRQNRLIFVTKKTSNVFISLEARGKCNAYDLSSSDITIYNDQN